MSPTFWLEVVVVGEGVLIVVLFVRVGRIEQVLRRIIPRRK